MYSLNKLVGIPFKDRGRDITGCDCMGLSLMAHESFGVSIPDFKIDSESSAEINSVFVNQLYSNVWEKLESPEVPCIVVFGFEPSMPDMVTHVGTYIGSGKVLHTLTDKSSQTFKLDHPFFKNKILGFYKYGKN
jgi:cell wall-associated NlpC family hydrolase